MVDQSRMDIPSAEPSAALVAVAKALWWIRLCFGVLALGLGLVVIFWPDATLRVLGVLFGIYLLLAGLFRVVVSFAVEDFSVVYRVFSAILGLLLIGIGVICLRNVTTSVVLLALFVGIAWLFEGLGEIILGIISEADPLRGWRILVGVLHVIAAFVVLIWPEPTLTALVVIGGVILLAIGVSQVIGAIRSARAIRTAARTLPAR